MVQQIESEQGNLTQYTDRQAKALQQKAELEVVLSKTGKDLTAMQEAREQATSEKKQLESDNGVIKKRYRRLGVSHSKIGTGKDK